MFISKYSEFRHVCLIAGPSELCDWHHTGSWCSLATDQIRTGVSGFRVHCDNHYTTAASHHAPICRPWRIHIRTCEDYTTLHYYTTKQCIPAIVFERIPHTEYIWIPVMYCSTDKWYATWTNAARPSAIWSLYPSDWHWYSRFWIRAYTRFGNKQQQYGSKFAQCRTPLS